MNKQFSLSRREEVYSERYNVISERLRQESKRSAHNVCDNILHNVRSVWIMHNVSNCSYHSTPFESTWQQALHLGHCVRETGAEIDYFRNKIEVISQVKTAAEFDTDRVVKFQYGLKTRLDPENCNGFRAIFIFVL